MWEVSWRPNKDCNILAPPEPFWLSQHFFPVFLCCSTGGLGPSLCWDMVLIPTDLNFLSPGLCNNLTPTCFLRASQFTLNSTRRQSKLSPDIFDRMHLLFTHPSLFSLSLSFFFLSLSKYIYIYISTHTYTHTFYIHAKLTHINTPTHMYMYIHIYSKKEGLRRDLYSLNLFILFLYTCYIYICMFPACCFRQRTCVAQGL